VAGLPAHPWLEQSLTIAGPIASAAYKTAVGGASAMLASPVELGRVMAEQGRILGDPAHRRPSGPESLQRFAPALQAETSGSARFDRARADDRQVGG
jgi:hypothetical protein